jgi:hypothetical protein
LCLRSSAARAALQGTTAAVDQPEEGSGSGGSRTGLPQAALQAPSASPGGAAGGAADPAAAALGDEHALRALSRAAASPEELAELQAMAAAASSSGRPSDAAPAGSPDVLRPLLATSPQAQAALQELQRQAARRRSVTTTAA